MTTAYSNLLGLALPVTGELSGTWGDTVNDYITKYLDDAIANAQVISGSQTAVTLSKTTGTALVAAGSGSTGSAQYALIRCTGNPASTLTITVSYSSLTNSQFSKTYLIFNSTSTNQSVVVQATTSSGTSTGVTITAGERALIAWNGTDFVKIATQSGTGEFVTVDTTNLEVTNIKAKDGTAAATIADSTGAITVSTLLNVDNLRLDGNTLSSTDSNGNVVLAPNGTGDVQLDADTVRIGDSNANATITTNGTGDLILNTNAGTNSGSITIEDGVNGNIIIAPNGTGQVQISNAALDLTTIEVTNIKAKDGTASMTLADTTGIITLSATAGTANGVLYLNGSRAVTSGSALTFDGTQLSVATTVNNAGIFTSTASTTALVLDNTNANGWGSNLAIRTGGTTAGFFGTIGSLIGSTAQDLAVYANSSNGFRVYTDGNNERLRITSGGQVNIGGNFGSTNNTLQVTGNAAIGYTTAAPTDGLIVAGNVGIGNASPTSKFVVNGTDVLQRLEGGGYGSLNTAAIQMYGGFGDAGFINGWKLKTTRSVQYGTGTNFQVIPMARDVEQTASVTVDTSGNVGIGTPTPSDILHLNRSSTNAVVQYITNTGGEARIGVENSAGTGILSGAGAYDTAIRTASGTGISFGIGYSAPAMRLNSSGNLGLGVTPSAYAGSDTKAIDVNSQFGVFNNTTGNGTMGLLFNAYYSSGSYKSKVGGAFTGTYEYSAGTGIHTWKTSGLSGSGAGTTISLTSAMTLDASGRLLINATTSRGDNSPLQVTNDSANSIEVFRGETSQFGPTVLFNKSRGSTGSPTVVGSGDAVGLIAFRGYDGSSYKDAALIQGVVDGTPGSNDMPGRIVFSTTADGASSTTERARITSGGYLLIGCTDLLAYNPGIRLGPTNYTVTHTSATSTDYLGYFNRESSDGEALRFGRANTGVGTISVTTTATAYNTSSDYRLKDNPQPLTNSGAFIDALKPKTWNWKVNGSRGVGFIAHEVQEVSPSSVTGEKDGEQMQVMEYGSAEFIANIVAELQSLRARVAQLEAKGA